MTSITHLVPPHYVTTPQNGFEIAARCTPPTWDVATRDELERRYMQHRRFERHHSVASTTASIHSLTPSERLMVDMAQEVSSCGRPHSDDDDNDNHAHHNNSDSDDEDEDSEVASITHTATLAPGARLGEGRQQPYAAAPSTSAHCPVVTCLKLEKRPMSLSAHQRPSEAPAPCAGARGSSTVSLPPKKQQQPRLYDVVFQLISACPGLERKAIRERVAREHNRKVESIGATLSDPRFRPGGGKPLWTERAGKFYAVAIDRVREELVNESPIKAPLLACSSNACIVCGGAAQSKPIVLMCDGCGAKVHRVCAKPTIGEVDAIKTFFCCEECKDFEMRCPRRERLC